MKKDDGPWTLEHAMSEFSGRSLFTLLLCSTTSCGAGAANKEEDENDASCGVKSTAWALMTCCATCSSGW
jgi:hypothetical protein